MHLIIDLPKLAEIKGEIDKLKTIVEDVHTPFSVFDRKSRHKN